MKLFVLTVVLCAAYVAAQGSSYRAAVVEYYALPIAPAPTERPVPRSVATAELLKNVAEFTLFAKRAKAEGAQIIVFPENGLYPADVHFDDRDDIFPYLESVPDPYDEANQDSLNICEQRAAYKNAPVLVAMSCLAKDLSMTIVFDMGSVEQCQGDKVCPEDGRWQFNTQVAMGSDGTLIGRYHKRHLYYEPGYNPSPYPQLSTFTTDFGVEFGMLICFDMLFHEPSFGLVVERRISNLVYSTSWVNKPPTPLANAVQQGYSRVYGMNVLASQNAHNAYLSSGMGIFSGGSVLATYYNNTDAPRSNMLLADVPIQSDIFPAPQISRLSVLQSAEQLLGRPITKSMPRSLPFDPALPIVRRMFTATPGSSDSFSLEVKDDLQCNFTYTIKSGAAPPGTVDQYFAMAIDARTLPDVLPAPVYACGIGLCVGEDCKDTLGAVQSRASVFSSLGISGIFDNKEVVYPLLSTSFGGLLPPSALSVGSVPLSSGNTAKLNTRMQLQRGETAEVMGAALLQILD